MTETKEKEEVLGEHYHHIDNGGLTIKIERVTDDDFTDIRIECEFSHMGNTANIMCWDLNKDDISKFAEVFNTAIKKLGK